MELNFIQKSLSNCRLFKPNFFKSKQSFARAMILNLVWALPFSYDILAQTTEEIAFISAVMTQPDKKFFYPEGLAAVIEPAGDISTRRFTIESYFTQKVDTNRLTLKVRGTWDRSAQTADRFIKITRRSCDMTSRRIQNAELVKSTENLTSIPTYAFLCTIEFQVAEQTPSGSISMSLVLKSTKANGKDFSVPRLFGILLSHQKIPLSKLKQSDVPLDVSRDSVESTFAINNSIDSSQYDVVRLSSSKGFSVGSGFFTRDVGSLQSLSTKFASSLKPLSGVNRLYVLTAAHVFPFLYRGTTEYDYINSNAVDLVHKSVYVNLFTNAKTYIDGARLISFDLTSDLAVVMIEPEVEAQISEARKASIVGLSFAESLHPEASMYALGFVASGINDVRPRLRKGWLSSAETATLLTANLGSLPKFLLKSYVTTSKMAAPGMSGGPVINSEGKVVGMVIEKPFLKNVESATAIDLTQETVLTTSKINTGYFGCQLFYNPFERVLFFERKTDACQYGDFGRGIDSSLNPLFGRWVLHEVLTPVMGDEGVGMVGGTGLIGGTAIINGTGIIGGTAIIGATELVGGTGIIHKNNIQQVNESIRKSTNGFGLDVRSFLEFETFGVRILEAPDQFKVPDRYQDKLILSVPVYGENGAILEYREATVRNVLVWLHSLAQFSEASFDDLLYN